MLKADTKLLFQGDSITDGARHRGEGPADPSGEHLGCGYAMITAAKLTLSKPEMVIRNLGISGNRITDLYARAKEHIWNLEPEVLSILIGVNDTWHERSRSAGVEVERYAKVYRNLLEETKARLPNISFVLCDPFVLDCGVVTEGWREEVDERRAVVRELATDFSTLHVPFQDAFDRALEVAPPAHWAGDGVHPTPAGHLLMSEAWLDVVCP